MFPFIILHFKIYLKSRNYNFSNFAEPSMIIFSSEHILVQKYSEISTFISHITNTESIWFPYPVISVEFRSRVACENDKLKLECNPYSRIAIYGAIFGRSEEENAAICSKNPEGSRNEPKHPCKFPLLNRNIFQYIYIFKLHFFVNFLFAFFTLMMMMIVVTCLACLVSYATETVMQICHGRRRCELIADIGTFGKPCSDDISMYLKVVYTCSKFILFFQII